ncbi:hypothetical protein ACI2LF_25450 [Kribbella sp. NPDC020789]
MTRLFLVTQGDRQLWVAALIDEDLWTYVALTGKFHVNEGLRHDYFMTGEAQYTEIGVTEATRLIATGIGHTDHAEDWQNDQETMDPDIVFASMIADLG